MSGLGYNNKMIVLLCFLVRQCEALKLEKKYNRPSLNDLPNFRDRD